MKIIFHKDYLSVYASDPAASKGRLEGSVNLLKKKYNFISTDTVSDELLHLNHSEKLISHVKGNEQLYKVACLAVGGAIFSAELAMKREASFALIRPPGHHASPDMHWGFCYFNNIAIAVKKLLKERKVKRVLIIDFDLHFGDGTYNSFTEYRNVTYHHPEASTSDSFIKNLKKIPSTTLEYEILGVSAGFDRGVNDWGRMLTDEDYTKIGISLKEISEEMCKGRRFAVLEGGYNHRTLGETIHSFLIGFR